MTIDQDLLDREFLRGQEAGRIEARVGSLEVVVAKTSETLEGVVTLINSTVTTVELLTKDIKNRAESDQRMREQQERAAEEKAKALKEERVNAAQVLKDDRELTALTLANESNKATLEVNKINKKWIPRGGWAQFLTVGVAIFAVLISVFSYELALAKANAKTPCVTITNVGCVINK